jgi:hypothetical protein
MTGREERSGPIEARSRAFLIEMFTDLRDDLEDRLRKGGRGGPEPERAGRELAIYEALLAGLAQGGAFPDDEAVREYVAGLATATDEENQYEQAALEHRAFTELVGALAAGESNPGGGR